jgi:cysteinyl-tRNA synthetase
MANWIDTMLAETGMDLREADLILANQKIARVQALMEKCRNEKRFDVADAIRDALNG